MSVLCDYCAREAVLCGGDFVYPHREDLAHKDFWICTRCDAYVGCHEGTTVPLGRLANPELRAAKSRAHEAFDSQWHTRAERSARYQWLSEQLGIPPSECHIGMFDVATCERVVALASTERSERLVRLTQLLEGRA